MKNPEEMWEDTAADGTSLKGFREGNVHVHETGFGTGWITLQTQPKEHIPFNNFVRDVDELLPPEMRLPEHQ